MNAADHAALAHAAALGEVTIARDALNGLYRLLDLATELPEGTDLAAILLLALDRLDGALAKFGAPDLGARASDAATGERVQ